MEPRQIINAAIATLTLFVFGLTLHLTWDSYEQYRAAEQVVRANAMADHLIQTAGNTALERGLTAAALGAKQPLEPDMRAAIDTARRDSEAAWQAALQAAQALIAANDIPASFSTTIETTQSAHQRLDASRVRIDSCLDKPDTCVIDGMEWVSTVSAYIDAAGRLREEIFLVIESPREVTQFNLTMKRWAAVATEHAGRERGMLAYYIGAHRPLPAQVLNDLIVFRGVVKRTTDEMIAFAKRPDADARITQAALTMQHSFLGDYEQLRQEVYAAAGNGEYPVDTDHWLEQSTHAIDTLIAISIVISQITEEYAQNTMRGQTLHMARHFALLLIAFGVALVGFIKVAQTANALFKQKELAEVTLHSIGDAVITTDAQARVEYMNPVAEELTGWSSSEARGRTLGDVFHIVNGLSREPESNPIEACLRERRVVGLASNTVLIRRDAAEFVIEDSAAPIFDRDGDIVGAVMVFYDVSLMRRVPHLLSYHATHDALTGLINRREFERRLSELLVEAKNHDQQHALCYLDLDQFKLVNDTCGHGVGDRLLCQLTYLLQEKVRDTDTLARLGGDEFGVLLANCALDRALQIADSLRAVVKNFRFVWENHSFDIGVSVGLVPITADSVSPSEVLSEADAACFAAKEKGRNRVQVYEPGDLELARRHGEMHWVSRLHKALEENRFRLYFQTIRPLDGDRTPHGEVLLRLEDETGNLVPPLAFLPAAERYDLMPLIDRWVIDAALRALSDHLYTARDGPPSGPSGLLCNINLSGASLE